MTILRSRVTLSSASMLEVDLPWLDDFEFAAYRTYSRARATPIALYFRS